jgi:Flp pilus assembly protein CpaB
LLPEHRVDVVVTWDSQVFDCFNPLARERESRSVVLLENMEVLAVDTQLLVRDDNEDKKMSRSVTLIGSLEMGRQIAQADELGTITLVLRGKEDSQTNEPRLMCNLDDYLSSCMAQNSFPSTSANGEKVAQIVVPVRLNRGGSNQDQMFLVRQNAANPLPDDQ